MFHRHRPQALRAFELSYLRPDEDQRSTPGHLQHVTRLKINKQQPRHRVGVQVAEGVEEQVAGKIRDGQYVTFHAHKSRIAASVGDVYRTFAVQFDVAGDEESVGVADQRLSRIVQAVAALGQVAGFACNASDGPQLDVLGAIAEGVHYVHSKALILKRSDPAIHAIAAAGVEVDAQQADRRAIRYPSPGGIAFGGQAVDLQRVW